jgi:hypothetical protein
MNEDLDKLQEIAYTLDQAYRHYFSYEEHCKSNEGVISVTFGNFWNRDIRDGRLVITGVEIFSYALGPSRRHHFSNVDDALVAVREWHAEEMAFDPDIDAN